MKTLFTARAVLVLVACLCLSAPSSAAEKKREWQTGKVLDTNRLSSYAGSVGSASGTATSIGDTTYGQVSGSSRAVYRQYQDYLIEIGDYVYVCSERLRWKWSKPAMLTVNGPVKAAIEKKHLYLLDEDGKEHETTISKKILKTAK